MTVRTLSDIDRLLAELADEGIASLAALRVLNCVRIPRRYDEIDHETGVGRTVVRKMLLRCPGLMEKVPLLYSDDRRERGAPPVAIVATEKGKRLLDELFPKAMGTGVR